MRLSLPAEPSSVGLARRAVRGACAAATGAVDDVVQCTSELVTNALLHGAPPILLEVAVDRRRVRVAVHDAGTGTVVRREPLSDDTLSGRGLGIVQALASRWGTERTTQGNVAWFEMPSGA
jgi:anti-sigma regulatory factor (Ser/Thr protein kinase)